MKTSLSNSWVVAITISTAGCTAKPTELLEARLPEYCRQIEAGYARYLDDVANLRLPDGEWFNDATSEEFLSWPAGVHDLYMKLPASEENLRLREERSSLSPTDDDLMARLLEMDGEFYYGVYSRSAANLGFTLPRCDIWFQELANRIQTDAKDLSFGPYWILFNGSPVRRAEGKSAQELLDQHWTEAYEAWLAAGPHLKVVREFLAEMHALPVAERCRRFPKALRGFLPHDMIVGTTRPFRDACENAGLDYDW